VLLVLPFSSSCRGVKKRKRYRSARVELPLGNEHVGVRTVFVRPADPTNYNCQLAVKAIRFEVRKYKGLFDLVDEAEAAEVEFVVYGEQGVVTKSSGSGIAIGPAVLASSSEKEVTTTFLRVTIIHRDEGVIYDNEKRSKRHPNTGMPKAAYALLVSYVKGE